MTSAVASGIPLRAAPLLLSASQDRQASDKGVHGAVKCLVQKTNLGNPFLVTSIRRRARQSPSKKAANKVNKFKVTAGSESSGDLEGGESEGSSMKQSALNFLHRRDLLWAATGTFSYLSSGGIAQSDPIPPSDMDVNHCSPVHLRTPGETQTCCLPDGSQMPAVKFEFEDLPMRTRRPAHILSGDAEYVEKYNEAYRIMKSLSDDDPRSFNNQWYIHCTFCNGAYLEPGNTSGLPLQYHFSWTFLPWHRMYVYFHERILGELIGDPTFALPFWNWDNQRPVGGNQMPRMFTDDPDSALYIAYRNHTHFPPALVNLSGRIGDEEAIICDNLSILHKGVVSATSAQNFFGDSYKANQTAATASPPPLSVHEWTGTSDLAVYPDNEDMGTFVYVARDPIFFAHHSNIDRLWTVWKDLRVDEATRGGRRRRQEPSDPDFMNAQFAFYDHHQKLVHVTVSDTINTKKLRYRYQRMESDSDWIDFKPRPSGIPKPSPATISPYAQTPPVLIKDEPRSFLLMRREATDDEAKAHGDEQLSLYDLEETLVIKGVKVPNSTFFAYSVFVNLPTADEDTPLDLNEFVGLITHIPHGGGGHDHSRGLDFRLSIGAAMKSLKLPVGEPVSVTLVPKDQSEDVPFEKLELEWR